MDKGFNDDELADIMSEIENLEKEFTGDMMPTEESVAAAPEEPVTEIVEETVEAEKIVEEPIAAVEETRATVEDSASIVEEHETIVENSQAAHIEATVDDIAEVAPVTEIHAETEPEPSIESVEKTAEPFVATVEPVEAEFEPVDAELNEVLEELSEMPVEDITGETATAFEDNIHHLKPAASTTPKQSAPNVGAGHSSMSFAVEGDMKLDLSFNISGKIVNLSINENGFELELEGGMKFNIPLDEVSSHKKVA
jgi:hypothetical protein